MGASAWTNRRFQQLISTCSDHCRHSLGKSAKSRFTCPHPSTPPLYMLIIRVMESSLELRNGLIPRNPVWLGGDSRRATEQHRLQLPLRLPPINLVRKPLWLAREPAKNQRAPLTGSRNRGSKSRLHCFRHCTSLQQSLFIAPLSEAKFHF